MNTSTREDEVGRGNGKAGHATHDAPRLTIGDLKSMSARELQSQFELGDCPTSLRTLDGEAPGTILSLGGLRRNRLVGRALRRLLDWERFPWRGKSFEAVEDYQGEGTNRVNLLWAAEGPGHAGERHLFNFITRFERSLIDQRPCVVLDYDLPGNLGLVRRMRDEMREISPGLFLGTAWLRLGATSRLLAWFAVEAPP